MSEKLISVIIPAYNHEKYVQETIRSVIAQTYGHIELIIIDDGSKDSTLEKIREMEPECAQRFARFLYQTQENQGTCVTLNRLLSLAQGEYVALIASDDKYTPNALADMSRVLDRKKNVALVVGENAFMDGESKLCYWDEEKNNVYEPRQARWLSFTDHLRETSHLDFRSRKFGSYGELLKSNHIANGYLIRRSIFEKTGEFTKEAPLEDHWLMLQIAKHARMKHIDTTTFYYRWHAANTIKQTEKMQAIMQKTLQYEYACVKAQNNKKALRCFREIPYIFLFKIPGIASAYKVKTETERLLYLNLFGYDILLSRKKRK